MINIYIYTYLYLFLADPAPDEPMATEATGSQEIGTAIVFLFGLIYGSLVIMDIPIIVMTLWSNTIGQLIND